MLKISLEYVVPDNKKPKKIEINASQNSTKEFLTEANHG